MGMGTEAQPATVKKELCVLVTGAAGFIGQPLVQYLVDRGRRVRAVVRKLPEQKLPQVEYCVCGEIDAQTDWSAYFKGIDVLVHLAGRAHVPELSDGAQGGRGADVFHANAAATRNMADHAVAQSVQRIVFISTIKVNGESNQGRAPFRADDRPKPQGDYARCKLDAENQLFDVATEQAIEVVVIRPPLVYGPKPKGNFLSLVKAVKLGLPLPLGAVCNQRSLVSVFNLCDLIDVCLTHPRAAGEVFLVSDGQDVSTPGLIRLLSETLGKKPRLCSVPPALLQGLAAMLGRAESMQRLCGDLQVDIAKTRGLLDWNPPYSLEQGLSMSRMQESHTTKA